MHYTLSALKLMGPVAYSRLISGEIDLPSVLTGRPTQQFPEDQREANPSGGQHCLIGRACHRSQFRHALTASCGLAGLVPAMALWDR